VYPQNPSATGLSDKTHAKTENDDALRKKNKAAIEKWFSVSFIEGADLFTEDGQFNDAKGKANVLKDATFNTKAFPDWKYSKVDVYSTQDPNKFFVESEGSGTLYKNADPASTPVHYANTYIMVFIMRDGKIKSITEKMSELNLLRALGINIPMDDLRSPSSMDDGK
jgi:phenazine biosynthesis protein